MALRTPAIAIAAVIAAMLTSCASTGSRGTLSDATDKARDDYEGRRQVEDTHVAYEEEDEYDDGSSCLLSLFRSGDDDGSVWNDHDDDDDLIVDEYESPEDISGPDIPWNPLFAFKPLSEAGFSDLYRHANGAALLFGGHYDGARIFAELGYLAATAHEASPFDSSFTNDYVGRFHISGGYRYYLTGDHTFMGLFVEGALAFSHAGWEYDNPLESTIVNEYGDSIDVEIIDSDGLWSVGPELAIGFSPVQTDAVCLSLIARAGARLYMPETREGFENDVIIGDAYLRLEAEVALGSHR